MTKQTNLEKVTKQIELACAKSNRSQAEVTLVAVTKTIEATEMMELYHLGIRHFGENRADVFLEKTAQFADKDDICWHYIGSLQTRKVKDVLPKINYLHSLDRVSLAKEIEKRATKSVKCFLQVNISGEESKHGFSTEEAFSFVQEANFQFIEIVGLMTMAPITNSEQELHHVFHELKHLQQEIHALQLKNIPCTELSMGMTQDFGVAITEGATFIRVGRALVSDENMEV
ncbi:YggS family pyridoxal phosphate-dependent enzyme [Listeria sp. FSL L7-1509]|uniref:Pyridoxal phosphate homeostasis protein n=1 Tax=Listeria immobilis TaxID=2713502 RepID=A0ABR6SX30_9LIST|nr:YggS family pyridoxal phosphate-dependent enzyme [Listeria immobilis]MBC1482899.1 YggS family pyridoxal phosphate-dependent enzyme [Listeria immobilis]MBC1507026.1 YggS family pyridoxal phosphate-dependent enzyme [Listeria immobilis]MBC1510237.1 YggS family pyridoxal phosphate-dependent enzyme [Listeria immobilis]MBC6303265.1 YggS family pyridoxal phosphate-dependent enzyme [Listeria immobilis]MBC6312564.1 YggS family pyridoxal phosphate-dependent enzyme [Listeria immobilis]